MGKFLLLASSIAPSSENLLTFLGISYITGDFNLDLLQSQNNSITAEFVENLFPFSFFSLNKKINAYNSVFCNINRRHIHKQHFNHCQKRTHCYRYFGPFSDIFNFFKRMRQISERLFCLSEIWRIRLGLRDTSTKRREEFNIVLRNADRCFINKAEDANTAYDSFLEKYIGIFDTCFPFRNVEGKELSEIATPWISVG